MYNEFLFFLKKQYLIAFFYDINILVMQLFTIFETQTNNSP